MYLNQFVVATTRSFLLSQFYIELGRWQCGSLLATRENYSGNCSVFLSLQEKFIGLKLALF